MKKKTAWAVWKKTVRRNETARAWSDGGLHDTVPQGPEREMRREAWEGGSLKIPLSVSHQKCVYYEWGSMWYYLLPCCGAAFVSFAA